MGGVGGFFRIIICKCFDFFIYLRMFFIFFKWMNEFFSFYLDFIVFMVFVWYGD